VATIAIGDIHGNLPALEDLLRKVLPELGPGDTLVFLGDYIDRGPNAAGCLERILRLKEDARFSVITLLGNHEDWLLRTFRDYHSHSWILGMEAFETIASYSSEAASTIRREAERLAMHLITEKPALPYEVFFDKVPASHLSFLNDLKPYHRASEVVCVHGGLHPGRGPVESQRPEDLIWGTDDFPDLYEGPDAIAYGHMNNAVRDESGWPLPCILSNHTFGLDTISAGVLTGMRFPDGQVFQSGRFVLTGGESGRRKA
jgi:predicted MPP superfamily phosphohydrolase